MFSIIVFVKCIFGFPFNEIQKAQWANALRLNLVSINKNMRVCSMHYGEEMFDRSKSRVIFRENAVPQVRINNFFSY